MKNRNFSKSFTQYWITLAASAVLVQSLVYAGVGGGTDVGGGGDASEARVNEIRSDILNWIRGGGPDSLTLPVRVPREQYVSQMSQILAPHSVVLGFVTTEQERVETNPELRVIVDGQLKTCRGFVSGTDRMPHILCNGERFAATTPSDQYRLIHHEYAGLAGLEQNLGASSDYEISNQLTDFLDPVTVLRLSVTRRTAAVVPAPGELRDGVIYHPTCYIRIRNYRISSEALGERGAYDVHRSLHPALADKGYDLSWVVTDREVDESDRTRLVLSVDTDYLFGPYYRRHIQASYNFGADNIEMTLKTGDGRVLDWIGSRRLSRIRELHSARGLRKMRRLISQMPRCVTPEQRR